MDASHQEEKDNRDKEQGQYLPWYVDTNVALQDDLRPATEILITDAMATI